MRARMSCLFSAVLIGLTAAAGRVIGVQTCGWYSKKLTLTTPEVPGQMPSTSGLTWTAFGLADGWFCIRRRRVFHPDPEMLPCFLPFPPHFLIQWVLYRNCSRAWTIGGTATAKPALIRIKHKGWFALFRIGDHYIGPAHFHALIATGAQFLIKYEYLAGHRRVRHQVGLICHIYLPPFVLSSPCFR
jgi:hypothetical protein